CGHRKPAEARFQPRLASLGTSSPSSQVSERLRQAPKAQRPSHLQALSQWSQPKSMRTVSRTSMAGECRLTRAEHELRGYLVATPLVFSAVGTARRAREAPLGWDRRLFAQ